MIWHKAGTGRRIANGLGEAIGGADWVNYAGDVNNVVFFLCGKWYNKWNYCWNGVTQDTYK